MKKFLLTLLAAGALYAQDKPRPLDDPTSKVYQAELRPLVKVARETLHTAGLDFLTVGIALKPFDYIKGYNENACGLSQWSTSAPYYGIIVVLRSDEYKGSPCAPGLRVPDDQKNTVVHELVHFIWDHASGPEIGVTALANALAPVRRRK